MTGVLIKVHNILTILQRTSSCSIKFQKVHHDYIIRLLYMIRQNIEDDWIFKRIIWVTTVKGSYKVFTLSAKRNPDADSGSQSKVVISLARDVTRWTSHGVF